MPVTEPQPDKVDALMLACAELSAAVDRFEAAAVLANALEGGPAAKLSALVLPLARLVSSAHDVKRAFLEADA